MPALSPFSLIRVRGEVLQLLAHVDQLNPGTIFFLCLTCLDLRGLPPSWYRVDEPLVFLSSARLAVQVEVLVVGNPRDREDARGVQVRHGWWGSVCSDHRLRGLLLRLFFFFFFLGVPSAALMASGPGRPVDLRLGAVVGVLLPEELLVLPCLLCCLCAGTWRAPPSPPLPTRPRPAGSPLPPTILTRFNYLLRPNPAPP